MLTWQVVQMLVNFLGRPQKLLQCWDLYDCLSIRLIGDSSPKARPVTKIHTESNYRKIQLIMIEGRKV